MKDNMKLIIIGDNMLMFVKALIECWVTILQYDKVVFKFWGYYPLRVWASYVRDFYQLRTVVEEVGLSDVNI